MSRSVLHILPSRSFIDSGLLFKSLIHYEFIFLYGIKRYSSFILLYVAVQFSQIHLLKMPSFFHCIVLLRVSKIRYPQVHGSNSGLSIIFHWSIVLILCHYHSIVITVALQYSLKSRRLIPPEPFFFLRIVLAIQFIRTHLLTQAHLLTESIFSKIRNKTRVVLPTLTTFIQRNFANPSYSNQIRKRNERTPNWKRRSKTVPVWR